MNDNSSVYTTDTKPESHSTTNELLEKDESYLFYIKKFLNWIRDHYREPKNIIRTLIICAILGGLSGAVYYLADTGQFKDLMTWVLDHSMM